MASKEALQNARVWSRRMGVIIDQEKLVKFLDDNFPGSVLVGPLTAVMMRHFKGAVVDNTDRFIAARIVADTLAQIIRADNASGNILTVMGEVVQRWADARPGVVFSLHGKLMCSAVSAAIAARTAERSRPSITNMILAAARGR